MYFVGMLDISLAIWWKSAMETQLLSPVQLAVDGQDGGVAQEGKGHGGNCVGTLQREAAVIHKLSARTAVQVCRVPAGRSATNSVKCMQKTMRQLFLVRR